VEYREKEGENFNYEDLLHKFHNMHFTDMKNYAAKCNTKNHIQGMLESLVEKMFHIFQVNTYPIFQQNKEEYGYLFSDFCNEETWVFSLNHDLIVEMLCVDLGFNLCFGNTGTLQLPYDNYIIRNSRNFLFGESDNNAADIDALSFAKGKKGVNSIKLHGGMNENT